jgi:hypothetical protein
LPQLIAALKVKGGENIIVICGGAVPRPDYRFLIDHGVAAVFGPGTNVLEAARAVLDLIEGKRRNACEFWRIAQLIEATPGEMPFAVFLILRRGEG